MDCKIVEFTSEYTSEVKKVILYTQRDLGINKDLNPLGRDADLDMIPGVYKDRGRFWIALVDSKVIGTIAVENNDGPIAKLRRMFVLPEYQGTGVAQQLLNTALIFAIETGYTEMELSTALFMKRAHSFYNKNGFEKIGEDAKEYFYKKSLK